MANFFISEAGGAANKGASTPSLGMSVAVHNAETFSPNDFIIAFDDGGAFTAELIPPSDGTDGNPITYEGGADGVSFVPTTGSCISLSNIDFNVINDPTMTGNGDDSCFETVGTAGAGGTNIVNRAIILSNGGGTNTDCDGFSCNNTSQLEINNPVIRDCFDTSDPTGAGSHQAFTAHTDSILVVNNPDVDNCQAWAVNTLNARLTVNGGIMQGALARTLQNTVSATIDSRLIMNGVTLINNLGATNPRGQSTTSIEAPVMIMGGSYTCIGGSLASNSCTTTYYKVRIIADNGTNTFHNQTTTGGIYNIINCNLGDLATADGHVFRAQSSGQINFIGNTVKSFSGSRLITYDDNANCSGQIEGNYFGDIIKVGSQAMIWIRGVLVGTVDIKTNIFGSATDRAERAILNDGVINNLSQNFFFNLSDTLAGAGTITTHTVNTFFNAELTGGTGEVDLLDGEVDIDLVISNALAGGGGTGGGSIIDSFIR